MIIADKLSNFGYLLEDLPKNIFSMIWHESQNLQSNERASSGLTSPGIAEHYYLDPNSQIILNEYIYDLKDRYFSVYPEYLNQFRFFTNNLSFICDRSWYNKQSKYEFIPNHIHDGILSYTVWVNIPYLRYLNESTYQGAFEFTYLGINGNILHQRIPVDKTYEGKIMIFPSSVPHCVYPYFDSDNSRISLSGNILFNTSY